MEFTDKIVCSKKKMLAEFKKECKKAARKSKSIVRECVIRYIRCTCSNNDFISLGGIGSDYSLEIVDASKAFGKEIVRYLRNNPGKECKLKVIMEK